MIHSIRDKKIRKRWLVFLIGCFLLVIFTPLLVAADDIATGDSGGIKAIPAPKFEASHDFEANAEKYYDFIGSVDDVHKEGIVVSDSYMKFAPGAQISGTRPGARVGIRLNDAGEVVLCEPFKKTIGK